MRFLNFSKQAKFLILFGLLIFAACRRDQLPEPEQGECAGATPTYNNDIQAIIDQSCAYSGCHLDSAPGVYDSYNGILPVLSSGLFRSRVIDLRVDAVQGMPPDNSPTGRPQNLTASQIDLISCWLDAGFPE